MLLTLSLNFDNFFSTSSLYVRDEFELEFSGSSRAGALFNFQAKTELTIRTICMSKNRKFLLLLKNYNQISQLLACIIIIINFKVIFMNWCKTISMCRYMIESFSLKQFIKKMKLKVQLIFALFFISCWMKKGHESSWAEKPLARAMARASLARIHLY